MRVLGEGRDRRFSWEIMFMLVGVTWLAVIGAVVVVAWVVAQL